MNKKLILIIFAFNGLLLFSQNPITVVDGFFLKIDKSHAINYLGYRNIKDTLFVAPDSAMKLIGNHGENGLFIINSKEPGNKKSNDLHSGDNLYFMIPPTFYINDSLVTYNDFSALDSKEIYSIEVVAPLTAVKQRGIDWTGGIIYVQLKK